MSLIPLLAILLMRSTYVLRVLATALHMLILVYVLSAVIYMTMLVHVLVTVLHM